MLDTDATVGGMSHHTTEPTIADVLQRLDGIDQRLDGHDRRFDALEHQVRQNGQHIVILTDTMKQVMEKQILLAETVGTIASRQEETAAVLRDLAGHLGAAAPTAAS